MIRHETIRDDVHQLFSPFNIKYLRKGPTFLEVVAYINCIFAIATVKKTSKTFIAMLVREYHPLVSATIVYMIIFTNSKICFAQHYSVVACTPKSGVKRLDPFQAQVYHVIFRNFEVHLWITIKKGSTFSKGRTFWGNLHSFFFPLTPQRKKPPTPKGVGVFC